MAASKKAKTRQINYWLVGGLALGLIAVVSLLFYRLGSIMPGITGGEQSFYGLKLGWHGIYQNPLNLPLNVLYSIVFKFFGPVGQVLLRTPAALMGGLTVIAMYVLLNIWYGTRTAIFGTILFAASAWTLHVSRLADYNVEYLAAMTFFLLTTAILQKRPAKKYIYWLINLTWSILIFVPGMVFVLLFNAYRQHSEIAAGMSKQTNYWSKVVYILSGLIWLPLLLKYLTQHTKNLLAWQGLTAKFASPTHIIKEFGAVFYHIYGRGPLLPSLWLGRLPILDIFGIAASIIGIYFYGRHIKATRTHLLAGCLLIGSVLIAMGGSVPLSFVIPIIYIFIAAGIAYLLTEWLSVFPQNPVARSLGYILISLAVAMSVVYNVREYFVAWPHNNASVSVFDVKDRY